MSYSKKNIYDFIRKIFIVLLVFSLSYTSFQLYKTYTDEKYTAFFFGYKPILMKTNNLSPLINKGDIVIIKKTDFNNIKKDNYIYFKANEFQNSIEKVTRVTEEGLKTTKMSNNKESLHIITKPELLGLGVFVFNISFFVKNPLITLIMAIIVFLLIYIINIIVKDKKDKLKQEGGKNE